MELNSEIYGKKIDYDPLWTGPLEKVRRKTDFPFFIVFLVYIGLWIGISIFAFKSGYVTKVNTSDAEIDIITKIHEVRHICLGFICLAAVLSIGYIILLRWFAKCVVYTTISLICGFFATVFLGCSIAYANDTSNSVFIAIASLCAILLLIVIIVVIVLRKKINIACEVIRESGKAVLFFPSTLLFPVLPYGAFLLTTSYGFVVHVYLSSVPKIKEDDSQAHIYVFHFLNFFGMLWSASFISAFTEICLAGTFGTWFWTLHKEYVPRFTLFKCIKTATRHHLGTISFGSLIVAICRLINIILSFIRRRLQGSCNPLVCCCFNWYKYLFENLERFVKYINRNAYIMTAIHGTSYIESAKNAFNLLMRNIINVFVTTKITNAVISLGICLTVSISVASTWAYCYHSAKLSSELTNIAMAVVGLSTMTMSYAMLMVLDMAVDTVFLSVLEDSERNDGTQEKPYYMSRRLRSIFFH